MGSHCGRQAFSRAGDQERAGAVHGGAELASRIEEISERFRPDARARVIELRYWRIDRFGFDPSRHLNVTDMKVREIVKIIEQDGWQKARHEGSRQY